VSLNCVPSEEFALHGHSCGLGISAVISMIYAKHRYESSCSYTLVCFYISACYPDTATLNLCEC
jgi:hypothetical protein